MKKNWEYYLKTARKLAGAYEEETGKQRSQNMEHGDMGLGILGQRQVMPRWANDPMWLNDGSRKDSGQGQMRAPPQTEIRRRAEKGGAG